MSVYMGPRETFFRQKLFVEKCRLDCTISKKRENGTEKLEKLGKVSEVTIWNDQ